MPGAPTSPPTASSPSVLPHPLSLSPSLYPSAPLSSSWTGGTAIRQDERPGGSGLLHHVPVVPAVPEGSDANRGRAGSTGGVRVRVRGGQAAGRDPARMGRLSGPIPGQIQLDLRGEEVFRAANLAWIRYHIRSSWHAFNSRDIGNSHVENNTIRRFSKSLACTPGAHFINGVESARTILRKNNTQMSRLVISLRNPHAIPF